MRADLITLFTELKKFDLRRSLDTIITLFDNHNALFSGADPTDEDLFIYWQPLKQLQADLLILQSKQDQLYGHSNISDARQQSNLLDEQINQLAPRRKALDNATKSQVLEIISELNKDRIANDQLACEYQPNALSLDIKIALLKEYEQKLSQHLVELEHLSPKFQIAQKFLEADRLIAQLQPELEQSVIFNQTELLCLSAQNKHQLLLATENMKQFDLALRDLTENISYDALEKVIIQLNSQLEEQLKQREEAESILQSSLLNDDERHNLSSMYNIAQKQQKGSIIDGIKGAASWHKSNWNPRAWVNSSLYPSSYQAGTEQEEQRLKYISALHNRSLANDEIQRLTNELEKQTNALSSPPKSSLLSLDEARESTILLLQNKDPSIVWKNLNPDELLAGLIFYISPVRKDLERLISIDSKLTTLLSIDSEIDSIRTEHQIMIGNDELRLDSEDYDNLSKALAQQTTFQDKKLICDQLLEVLGQLKSIDSQLIRLKKERLNIRKNLNARIQTVVQSNPQLGLADTETTIRTLISTISALPFPKQLSPFDRYQKFQTQVNDLNKQITDREQFESLSPELKAWYTNLFAQINALAFNDSQANKAIQLLHDIDFELLYETENDQVLAGYRQSYPDLQSLLVIKPPVPLELPAQTTLPDRIQIQLDLLYDKAAVMTAQHPKQAALLEQLTQNLHHIALMDDPAEKLLAGESIQHQMEDPRYKTMLEHRGFGRVTEWLARLCTSVLKWFKGEDTSSYRDRFFYKETHSEQLYLRARSEVLLPEPDEGVLNAVFG